VLARPRELRAERQCVHEPRCDAGELPGPEAAVGGPMAAVKEGDTIAIDIEKCTIDLEISDAEMKSRLAAWTPREERYASGVFQKYVKLVGSASRGAVTG